MMKPHEFAPFVHRPEFAQRPGSSMQPTRGSGLCKIESTVDCNSVPARQSLCAACIHRAAIPNKEACMSARSKPLDMEGIASQAMLYREGGMSCAVCKEYVFGSALGITSESASSDAKMPSTPYWAPQSRLTQPTSKFALCTNCGPGSCTACRRTKEEGEHPVRQAENEHSTSSETIYMPSTPSSPTKRICSLLHSSILEEGSPAGVDAKEERILCASEKEDDEISGWKAPPRLRRNQVCTPASVDAKEERLLCASKEEEEEDEISVCKEPPRLRRNQVCAPASVHSRQASDDERAPMPRKLRR